ncbi:hypothetical protein D9M72_632950 [compost metagenome]
MLINGESERTEGSAKGLLPMVDVTKADLQPWLDVSAVVVQLFQGKSAAAHGKEQYMTNTNIPDEVIALHNIPLIEGRVTLK